MKNNLVNMKSIFILIYISVYYVVLSIPFDFSAQHIGNLFHLIAPLIATIWIFYVFRLVKHNERYFWVMLSLGCLSYSIAQGFWMYEQLTNIRSRGFLYSEFFWMMQYVFFFIALIYGIYNEKKIHITVQFLFFLLIFFTAFITLLWDFLITTFLDHTAQWILFTLPLYTIANLMLFIGFISLYSISKNKYILRNSLLLISVGFFVKFLANLLALYLTYSLKLNEYFGTYIDLLWSLGLLLIGYAGTIVAIKQVVNQEREIVYIKKPLQQYGPYFIACFLFFIMFYQIENWDAIIVGSIITFFLIIVRQLVSLDENRRLLVNYENLNKNLEVKVKERTLEINKKSEQLKEALNMMNKMAYYDELTGLPNRNKINTDFDRILTSDSQELNLVLFFMGIDKFKFINDSMGYKYGDLVLKWVSDQLIKCLDNENFVYRYGGDEFIVLIENKDKNAVEELSKVIINELSQSFVLNNIEMNITTSIGISIYPYDGIDLDTLIKYADIAMCEAKRKGRNNIEFFNLKSNDLLQRRSRFEIDLRKAIVNNEFELNYQPQIDLITGTICGYEALLRWNHPEMGILSPLEFISIAEDTGLILPIGEEVLRRACIMNKKWQKQNPDLRVAVNVSVKQLNSTFINTVLRILEETQLSPEHLELEITESIIQNMDSIELLNNIKKIGVKISIDDFGTGYSSLSVLKHLPLDYLKIDRSFINDLTTDSTSNAIVKTIINLGHDLGFKIIAEGIENLQQLNHLKNLKCDIAQGYYFSVPLPEEQIYDHINNSRGTKQWL